MSNFKDVISVIDTIQDKRLLEDFLVGITTTKERDELAKRLEVVKRLLDGQPQHKIAEDLGVGVGTVTRGSKELADGRFKVLRKDNA
jgi:TrpR family transcriptional regulator, trp operon repressor